MEEKVVPVAAPPAPASDTNSDQSSWDNPPADLNTPAEPSAPAPADTTPPAEAIKPDKVEAPVVDPNAPPQPGDTPAAPAPAAPDPAKDPEKLSADLKQAQDVANYYMTLFNERYNAELAAKAAPAALGQPGAPPAVPPAEEKFTLPEGVLPPEQWKSQEDYGKYVDAVAEFKGKTVAQKMIKDAEANLKPAFERISQVLESISDMVIRAQYPDFEDIIKSVVPEIWNMDPAGNLLGVKNPALLQYIQKSPLPKLALYQYGVSKKAPDKIKEAATNATGQLIKDLQNKPKVTMPSGPSGGVAPEKTGLDWDTDPKMVDKLLASKNLI